MAISIRRTNPLREMAAMQNAMDRMFEDTWRNVNDSVSNPLALDIHENSDGYTLLANVPGVNPDNIEITMHEGALTIGTEIAQPETQEGTRIHTQERPYGQFSRTLRLPRAVDANAIEADYENGVLQLWLPKSADAQPRQIPVRVGNTLTDGDNG